MCTHLGCVVPWNKAENKFKCPCHGSQYDANGMKIRGPAPLVRAAGQKSGGAEGGGGATLVLRTAALAQWRAYMMGGIAAVQVKQPLRIRLPPHGLQSTQLAAFYAVLSLDVPSIAAPLTPPPPRCPRLPLSPQSLPLAHMNLSDSGVVTFTTWTETDFRTGEAPWWK